MKPTAEELKMTSLPGYPGVPAVVLYREEVTRDDMHAVLHYDRIKVLTEEGKKYANVELSYGSFVGDGFTLSEDKMVDTISGRTIHPDGTIIPFTGKPYLKTIEKGPNVKYEARIFSLPDVEVGSIIEYRYATRYNDRVYEAPDWYIQGDLFLRDAHFTWYPTVHDLQDSRGMINTISWFPILPEGAKITTRELPASNGLNKSQQIYDLVVKNVPPNIHEEYMPPIASYSYRVLFNFSSYRTADEYWKSEGKQWSKQVDSFAKVNGAITTATQAAVVGAATPDEKLHRIYASVMKLENTRFTRAREQREDKANGLAKVNDASEVLAHERGDPSQLTELFVAMARAAGFKADLMLVPDRSEQLFTPLWLSFRQFDDLLAVVNVDGKEEFFDPGSRYCAYKHLAWQHSFVEGLRQKDGATLFQKTPGDSYPVNLSTRVANLTMDGDSRITGKIDLTFGGAPALRWRQDALRDDEESLRHDLREHLQRMIPGSLEVKVLDIGNVTDYDKPLLVSYQVKGSLGTQTGKRLVMPADLFLSDQTATFSHEKREEAVYFHYPQRVQDALRINFPSTFAVEAAPAEAKFSLPKSAIYHFSVTSTPTNFTTRRDYAMDQIFILQPEYADLRGFYSKFESNDQQSVVLKLNTPSVASASPSESR